MQCNYTQLKQYIDIYGLDKCENTTLNMRLWKKKKIISMVKRGVYLPTDLMDKYKIACSSVDNGILCYHAALEYYLLQTQEFNSIYVYSSKYFRDFDYLGITYIYKPLKFIHNPVIIKSEDGFNITVTSLEQTIVDCIYNINLAGGLEELLYAIKEIDGSLIKEKELKICLDNYNSKSLYQRAGFLLQPLKMKWRLSNKFFAYCKKKSKGNTSYLVNPFYCNVFNKEWNLCIPNNMSGMLKE